ncbi:MAG: gamma-glutamyltransferase [Bacteroidetes bacterium OLB9]|nr:MAG: gamma-glutamyltransferase [Bacteroidetes bacterium OLB9]
MPNYFKMQSKTFSLTLRNILYFFLIFLIVSCKINKENPVPYTSTKSISSDSAMVVSAHPLASAAGINILKQGGNAIDAAIAVQFALAVCYPGAGNIGGGGFLVYRSADGQSTTLDYREKAPARATTDMYLDKDGNAIEDLSKYGHLAAGVPGTVDGMYQAYEKYSKLRDWTKLISPAIELAEKGFRITEAEAAHLNAAQDNFKKYNRHTTSFEKEAWAAGDLLVQSELASTLKRISKNGRAGFYEGETAQLIVDEKNAGKGLISLDDLKNYHSVWREPLKTTYRGYDIISMPPPSSGGIALAQLLKMVEPYPIDALKFQSAASVHLITEAERRVYADRAYYLGDPDFVHVPTSKLIDPTYLEQRMSDFNPRQASKSEDIKHGMVESEETTHYSIVDQYGNAVSVTTTLNGSYGSYIVVKGAGFLLNNEMDDFSVKPGTPNLYGLIGAEANKIEPNKRMLSSMTPTIVTKDNSLKIVVGTPGGSTIITSVFQTIINVIDYGMNINEAVQAPRFHHQWLPDVIYCEKGAISESERKILYSIGHKFEDRDNIGRVEAILIDDGGQLHGAADHRGDDDVKGF